MARISLFTSPAKFQRRGFHRVLRGGLGLEQQQHRLVGGDPAGGGVGLYLRGSCAEVAELDKGVVVAAPDNHQMAGLEAGKPRQVVGDLRFQAIERSPGSFGLANITEAVCVTALPNCTTATLLPGAAVANYLWSDDRRLAPGGHAQLASLAIDRARRNPF